MLADCLQQLEHDKNVIGNVFEVIVSDDGNKENSKGMIETNFPWVKWVQGPCKGPASNRNNAASLANGEWLIFLDDDCIPDTGIIGNYMKGIQNNTNTNVFEGRIYADREKRRMDEESPINETGGYLWSCNFMIKTDLFTSLKGFDESFPYAAMEDAEFRYRIQKRKQNIVFLKSASVCHPWRLRVGFSNVIDYNKKHFASLKKMIEIHPELRSKYNTKYNLSALYRVTITFLGNLVKYRGKGAMNGLARVYWRFLILFK
jgi:GT2 family glycosyltransferase